MHELIITSSLVAMLIVPCLASMRTDVSTEEAD